MLALAVGKDPSGLLGASGALITSVGNATMDCRVAFKTWIGSSCTALTGKVAPADDDDARSLGAA